MIENTKKWLLFAPLTFTELLFNVKALAIPFLPFILQHLTFLINAENKEANPAR